MMPRSKAKLVQHNYQIGYWRGGKQGEAKRLEVLTKFGMQLSDSYKGYLVRVTQTRMKGGIREGVYYDLN